jgi:hypothetical protein
MAFAKEAVLKLLEPTPRNSLAGLCFYFYLSAFCYPDRRQADEQQTAEDKTSGGEAPRKEGSMQCHHCAVTSNHCALVSLVARDPSCYLLGFHSIFSQGVLVSQKTSASDSVLQCAG